MLALLFYVLLLSSARSEDQQCHPFISEISTLGFTTTEELQYVELSVSESCRANRRAMQSLKLANYGFLIVDTKSSLQGSEDYFQLKTFVDFGEQTWPKRSMPTSSDDSGRGGAREADVFRKFFVFGGPSSKSGSVPPMSHPSSEFTMHFDIYGKSGFAECVRFFNWPYCDREVQRLKAQRSGSSIQRFLKADPVPPGLEVPKLQQLLLGQIAFILVHFPVKEAGVRNVLKEEFVQKFSYIQYTSSNNKIFVPSTMHVGPGTQMWISPHIVDIVVVSPDDKASSVLPMTRLDSVWKDLQSEMVFHILPHNQLARDRSISRCGEEEGESYFAITIRTPGYQNTCHGSAATMPLRKWRRIQDRCLKRPLPVTQKDSSLDNHVKRPRVEPVGVEEEECDSPALNLYNDQRHSDDLVDSCAGNTQEQEGMCVDDIIKQQEQVALELRQIKEMSERLIKHQQFMEIALTHLRFQVQERNQIQKDADEYHTLNVKRKYGLYLSPTEKTSLLQSLRSLEIDGKQLSGEQQTLLLGYEWISFFPKSPGMGFFRCKLCNHEHLDDYNPESDHRVCSSTDQREVGRNLLGAGMVLCLSRFKNSPHPISRLIERIRQHAKSKEHTDLMKEFSTSLMEEKGKKDYTPTVTTALTAYTIAKEGFPFSGQLPLIFLGMRSGAAVPSGHYDQTSAHRMIECFATHMKYYLLKHLTSAQSPFSLIFDGSSSSRGTKWLVFLMRTLTLDNRPITYHFHLAETARETGETIANAILDHFRDLEAWKDSPGLDMKPLTYAMMRMVAVTTDGASNNMFGNCGRL
ncbi:hypothetical protein Y032_0050g1961 [Ancylostoma ceylanicum]|nr:hypothetical protein Y032_0050g1961 [Ancylostoma ceylanicum]